MWWVEHVHEVLNVVQGLGHGFAGAPVLVEVNVQGAGSVKQTPDVRISRLFAQTVHCSEQLPMTLVFPVAACCDGLHDLRGGAPAFLGSLADVAGGELGPGLGQEDAAGFEVLLSGHADYRAANGSPGAEVGSRPGSRINGYRTSLMLPEVSGASTKPKPR